jgi:RHS repeat-associated protein
MQASLSFKEIKQANFLFSFNGKEKDDEIKGDGNSLDFGARIYDSRLGRFLSLDPKFREFPSWSPYIFALDNPIRFIDVEGEGPGDGVIRMYTTKVQIGKTTSGEIKYKYLAKTYYTNQTKKAAKILSRRAESPNGWYEVTQDTYEKNQKNPKVTQTYGADTPVKDNDISNQPISRITPEVPEGNLKVEIEGGESGTNVEYGYYDSDDNKIPLGNSSVRSGENTTVQVPFSIPEDGALYVEQDGTSSGVEVSASTNPKQGDRAPDTMENYGKEQPVPGIDYQIENQ